MAEPDYSNETIDFREVIVDVKIQLPIGGSPADIGRAAEEMHKQIARANLRYDVVMLKQIRNKEYYLLTPWRYVLVNFMKYICMLSLILLGSYQYMFVVWIPMYLFQFYRFHRFAVHAGMFNVAPWKLWAVYLTVCMGCGILVSLFRDALFEYIWFEILMA